MFLFNLLGKVLWKTETLTTIKRHGVIIISRIFGTEYRSAVLSLRREIVETVWAVIAGNCCGPRRMIGRHWNVVCIPEKNKDMIHTSLPMWAFLAITRHNYPFMRTKTEERISRKIKNWFNNKAKICIKVGADGFSVSVVQTCVSFRNRIRLDENEVFRHCLHLPSGHSGKITQFSLSTKKFIHNFTVFSESNHSVLVM